ncbi:uncharacterized protein C8Q71DRAFT_495091 [Rhodofomes roseus]|uniref:Uncharacterized protein n=1 Tax=Rhodofomes roseus TaxID=34475 RepID=A0ABQ8KMK3_9APHY|nr:uncharacterized protein C8Q71DRAFT_495091 [Rhodofomes roseus]KAH9839090.1 hypothetical protein C8Q71DRAFT_495091 [Rhodofomes roseus]
MSGVISIIELAHSVWGEPERSRIPAVIPLSNMSAPARGKLKGQDKNQYRGEAPGEQEGFAFEFEDISSACWRSRRAARARCEDPGTLFCSLIFTQTAMDDRPAHDGHPISHPGCLPFARDSVTAVSRMVDAVFLAAQGTDVVLISTGGLLGLYVDLLSSTRSADGGRSPLVHRRTLKNLRLHRLR